MLNYLMAFYENNYIIKAKYILLLSFPLSIINITLNTISGWVINNNTYIIGVLLCIAIDHLLGSILHLCNLKDFTFKKNLVGLLQKLGLCVAGALIFEIIQSTLSELPFIYNYLKTITRLAVILYPASSALVTIRILTNGKFPPSTLLKRFSQFNNDLNIERLTKSKKNLKN